MKILYFHQHFSTPKGSAGIRSYEMARRAIHHGHEVTMVCGSYGGGKTGLSGDFTKGKRAGNVDGIDIIEFDLSYSNADTLLKRTKTFMKFSIKSIGLVFTEDYDLVFATTTPLTAGIPGVFARWFEGKPFVFEVRDLWPELPKAMGVIKNPIVLSLMSFLEYISYRSACRCIGLSPGIVKGIKKRGVAPDKIKLIPNGCDLNIFNSSVNSWRPDGVKDSDLMAVFTGTHGLANGLDTALDAAKELKKRGREDIKLVFVGQGKLKPQLQRRAEVEELTNVIFCPPVDKARLAELMSGADIGMQLLANIPAFYFGTSPNKFFDYIAAGLPVLNNYPGWLADMITDENCGYAVAPENTKLFADALESASVDKGKLEIMGANAKRLAKASFARQDLADSWVEWVVKTK